jgi:RNA polymerase sigma-70 factor (ECF subfamily)
MSCTASDLGDPSALFDRYKERLRRTVRLRLDRRLVGVVDSSGVLRMAREEAVRRADAPAWSGDEAFLWLRRIVGEVLARLHHERLGPDARGDISLYRGALPEATSVSLAAHLLGKPDGNDAAAVARAEQKLLLQETLNSLDPIDREVLTLRHCEQLSNDEAAAVLGLQRSQASEAYIRALKRVSPVLTSLAAIKGRPSS